MVKLLLEKVCTALTNIPEEAIFPLIDFSGDNAEIVRFNFKTSDLSSSDAVFIHLPFHSEWKQSEDCGAIRHREPGHESSGALRCSVEVAPVHHRRRRRFDLPLEILQVLSTGTTAGHRCHVTYPYRINSVISIGWPHLTTFNTILTFGKVYYFKNPSWSSSFICHTVK